MKNCVRIGKLEVTNLGFSKYFLSYRNHVCIRSLKKTLRILETSHDFANILLLPFHQKGII